jgi:hypothetical protein
MHDTNSTVAVVAFVKSESARLANADGEFLGIQFVEWNAVAPMSQNNLWLISSPSMNGGKHRVRGALS